MAPFDVDRWARMHAQARDALAEWDAWCLDDGRPAMALRAAAEYLAAPTEEAAARLHEATNGAYAAWLMAVPQGGTWVGVPNGEVRYRAANVALGCYWVAEAVLYGSLATGYEAYVERVLRGER